MEKSNEITAIPLLLEKQYRLKVTLLHIDAMGTQTAIQVICFNKKKAKNTI